MSGRKRLVPEQLVVPLQGGARCVRVLALAGVCPNVEAGVDAEIIRYRGSVFVRSDQPARRSTTSAAGINDPALAIPVKRSPMTRASNPTSKCTG